MFRKSKTKQGFPFAEHPYTDRPLLLVSGMGRSGTTILRNCVAAHSQIECRNAESNYIHDLMRAASENEEKPSRIPALPVTADEYWQLHQQFILHLLWPVDRTEFDRQPAMIATYSMLDPRTAMGLAKAFPSLTIFYIIRNGIEVVSSFQAFEAFQDLPFEHVCKIWSVRRDMLHFGRDKPEFHLFRYEWLLEPERFESEFRQALERSGLGWEPQCLASLAKRYHPTTFPGESRFDASDLSRRSQRWRFWSAEQRRVFVQECRCLMDELGYPLPWLDGGGQADAD